MWKGILTKNPIPFNFFGYSIGQIFSLCILTDYTISCLGFVFLTGKSVSDTGWHKFPRFCLPSMLYKQSQTITNTVIWTFTCIMCWLLQGKVLLKS